MEGAKAMKRYVFHGFLVYAKPFRPKILHAYLQIKKRRITFVAVLISTPSSESPYQSLTNLLFQSQFH